MGIKFNINLTNKWLYTLIVFTILAVITIGVYAVDTSQGWHSTSQIDFSGVGACDNICIDNGGLWTQSGSNIYYNNGKVGIGGINSNFKLNVEETGIALTDSAIHGKANKGTGVSGETAAGSSNPAVNGYNSASGIFGSLAKGDWGLYTNGKAYIAGDVGIGTTSPGAKLDVNGNVNVGGKVTAGSFSNDISCDWTGWTSVGGISCSSGSVCDTWIYSPEVYCSGGIVTSMRTASACIHCFYYL